MPGPAKYFKHLFLIVATLILLVGCHPGPQKNAEQVLQSERPNIIFFIADDMYPEMFNCLPEGKGKNLTPNLDRIAADGVLMVNQYVASPVSTPSRYNCLTGRYASRATNEEFVNFTAEQDGQTVLHWNTFINEQDKILPHYLQELGYSTAMVGKSHVIEVDSLYFFPDFWADPKAPDIKAKVEENYQRTVHAVLRNGFNFAGSIYFDNPNFVGLGELAVQNMDWIAAAGLEFIDLYYQQPFFLYFATTIPHQPSDPERSWKANPLITARGYLKEAPEVLPPRHTLPERIREAGLEGNNKELILWLDDALGALISRLEEYNILDNTIIFFFNDHGQKAKGTLYQDGVLSPCIVWKKGGFACGNRCEVPVQNIDFTPTILEMAGEDSIPSGFDGVSFKPLLDGKSPDADRALFFELGYARAVIKGDYKYYAIRYPAFARNMSPEDRAQKLEEYNDTRRFRNMKIVNEDPMAPFSHFSLVPGGEQAEHESYGTRPAYFETDQLYNIQEDPNELKNLANDPEHAEKLKELQDELKEHLAGLPGKFDI